MCETEKNGKGEYLTYRNIYNQFYLDQIRSVIYDIKTDENGDPILNEDGTPRYKYGNNNPDRAHDRFVEWWLDGAKGAGAAEQYYDWKGIIETVRRDNPGCLIFGTTKAEIDNTDERIFNDYVNAGGVHWIGNEEGYAFSTTWSKLDKGAPGYEDTKAYPRPGEYKSIEGHAGGDIWSVPEVNSKLLNSGWFWSESKEKSVLSVSRLGEKYFESVGYGGVMLLNVSPNTDGGLGSAQSSRLAEFGAALRGTFKIDLAKQSGASAAADSVLGGDIAYSASRVLDDDASYWAPEQGRTTGSIEIDLGAVRLFDVVMRREYIPLGQRVTDFYIEYKTESGAWREFGSGTTIGAKRLVRRAAVRGSAVRVNITGAYASPLISGVGVFKAAEAFEVSAPAARPAKDHGVILGMFLRIFDIPFAMHL